MPSAQCNLLYIWVLFFSVASASANAFQCPTNIGQPYSNPLLALSELYPSVDVVKPKGNPSLGKQNTTYACALAFAEFLNNGCTNTSSVWVTGLQNGSQFPCAAQWNGDPSGAPVVKVSYEWAESYCPGWQLSAPTKLTQWLQLLVGFVLPAAAFCLNIPRRRRFRVWDALFPYDTSFAKLFMSAVRTVLTVVVIVVDTSIWLLVVFAVAAPALLSGLYEAILDKRVLAFMDQSETSKNLPQALRARILFTVLCGNLDLYPAWADAMNLAAALDSFDEHVLNDDATDEQSISAEKVVQMNLNVYTISNQASTPDTELNRNSMAQTPGPRNNVEGSNQSIANDVLQEQRKEAVGKIASRLTAMLASQFSFGSVIAVPVLFYLGAFIYTLAENRQSYGDTDVAYALSFGMWWMVVPHIAIVAGLLLGGNNPKTLEGIVDAEKSDYRVGGTPITSNITRRRSSFAAYHEREHKRSLYSRVFERVYEAAYKPASIWNRGRSKQNWLLILYADSLFRYQKNGSHFTGEIKQSMDRFMTETIPFTALEWIILANAALLLIFVPCLLGFLVSFYTPQVGLACRSMTFVVYVSAQTLLIILWTLRTTIRDRYWTQANKIRNSIRPTMKNEQFSQDVKTLKLMAHSDVENPLCGGLLQCSAKKRSTSDEEQKIHSKLAEPKTCCYYSTRRKQLTLSEYSYYTLLMLSLGASVFSSIGTTLMLIIGVFRNNICRMNVRYWLPGHRAGAMLQLSSNSAEAIREAKVTWMVVGCVSVGVLLVCCYIGWWYQTKLRRHFKLVVSKLKDKPENATSDVKHLP